MATPKTLGIPPGLIPHHLTHEIQHGGPDAVSIYSCSTVTVFLEAGTYFAVDWGNRVLVDSGVNPTTVLNSALTYLNGLGGGVLRTTGAGTWTIGAVTVYANTTWESDWSLTFNLTGTISVGDNTELNGLKIFLTNGADVHCVENIDTAAGNSNISIFGCHIDANGTHQTVCVCPIQLTRVDGGMIEHNWIYNAHQVIPKPALPARGYGIYLLGCTFFTVKGNHCDGNGYGGIGLYAIAADETSRCCTVVGNICINSPNGHGIQASNGFGTGNQLRAHNTFTGNICYNNVAGGITLHFSWYNVIDGNIVYDNGSNGINMQTDTGWNIVVANHSYSNTGDGIFQGSASGRGKCIIVSNWSYENGGDGIEINSKFNLVVGNQMEDMTVGIRITGADGDLNLIQSNIFEHNTTDILINAAVNTDNIIGDDNFFHNFTTCITDNGTDTKLPTLPPKDFVYWGGGSAGYIVGNPSGVDLDADGEIAVAHIPLPLKIHQVVRVVIWAYSNVAEATNNMLLEIRVDGGGSSEPFNTEPIDVANHPSEETGGIAINDVIHWVIDAGDDADIGDLLGGDYLEVQAMGEAAVAPDIATDGLFGGIQIEYV